MEKYYINQENWQRIYFTLQGISSIRVKEESATYQFIEGVYFIMKTGAQWRELPSCYGKWRTIHKRYESW
jgi:transposase